MPSRLASNGSHTQTQRHVKSNATASIPSNRPDPDTPTDASDTDNRPPTAPGRRKKLNVVTSFDDSEQNRPNRAAKPLLLRSKSEHIVRRDDAEPTEEGIYEWGARHGFEDHYQSEDIISQLANVSSTASCMVVLFIFYICN